MHTHVYKRLNKNLNSTILKSHNTPVLCTLQYTGITYALPASFCSFQTDSNSFGLP